MLLPGRQYMLAERCYCEAESGLIYTGFLAGSCHFSTSKHSAVHYLVGLALALNKHSKWLLVRNACLRHCCPSLVWSSNSFPNIPQVVCLLLLLFPKVRTYHVFCVAFICWCVCACVCTCVWMCVYVRVWGVCVECAWFLSFLLACLAFPNSFANPSSQYPQCTLQWPLVGGTAITQQFQASLWWFWASVTWSKKKFLHVPITCAVTFTLYLYL